MKIFKNKSSLKYFTRIVVGLWSILVLALAVYQVYNLKTITINMAINEARTHFKKDKSFRLWGTFHGGVYVPVTEVTPANPYLSHVKERDIVTPSGKKLTLVNPAYMMRQINELFSELYGISGHITSLKLLRPENAPDDWERKALEAFEQGETETLDFVKMHGEDYIRVMRPLYIDKGCLKCHGKQGYKVGDVRGGISVSFSMVPFYNRENRQKRVYIISYFIIWFIGVIGIVFGASRLKNRITERDIAYQELHDYKEHLEDIVKQRTSELEEANESLNEQIDEVKRINTELKDFSHIVSHDLKSPLTSLSGMSEFLLESYGEDLDDRGKHFLDRIIYSSHLMNDLINGLTELSSIGREEENKVKIDLGELMQNIIEEHQQYIKVNGVKVEITKTLPTVLFSRVRIYQLFSNLFNNALKFSREGVPSEIIIDYSEDEREYTFTLRDNGIGIAETNKGKVFEMFSRLKEKDIEGTGVGLSVVKKIIEDNGGKIWLKSKKSEYTTFFFTILKHNLD